jgi:PAP2 superfamily
VKKELCVLLGIAGLTGAALPASSAAASSSRPRGDPAVVLTWDALAMTAVATPGRPAPEQNVYMSYEAAAVYDAVAAIDHRSDQYRLDLHAPPSASPDAAAATAAHDVLVAYLPTQSPTLDAAYTASLAAIPDGRAKDEGISVGRQAAQGIVTLRTGDGLNGPTTSPLPPGPGIWVPTPPATIGIESWLGHVEPFLLRSATQYQPPGPPDLHSAEWARAFNETRIYGDAASTVRTPAQTEVAQFWSDAPVVQEHRSLRALALQRHLDQHATATLLARSALTVTDAMIACFNAKYRDEFWRPFTAIAAADTDGNPDTTPDPTWAPLLATPDHPEYPAAHTCDAGALAVVLAATFGLHVNVDVTSDITHTTHHFATVIDLVTEVANARVWGGIHYRFSVDDGAELCVRVALWDTTHFPSGAD